jgi:hypothetical protein
VTFYTVHYCYINAGGHVPVAPPKRLVPPPGKAELAVTGVKVHLLRLLSVRLLQQFVQVLLVLPQLPVLVLLVLLLLLPLLYGSITTIANAIISAG